MSVRKRKNLPGLQQTFESIKEVLLTAKSQLDDPKPSSRTSLVQNLHQIASLGELLSEQRPKSSDSEWTEIADKIDQEGVSLWNISGIVRKSPEDDGHILVAALRLAAFRLVEAGLELKPGIEGLLHVLQLASKTGATLSELGNHDVAATVLASAAKYEELLRNSGNPDGVDGQAIACATVVYFSSRMEAAWREGNQTVAECMSQKITEDEQRLASLPVNVRENIAHKFHTIGKSLLKNDGLREGARAEDAVIWLQKSFSVADRLEEAATPGIADLKISVLRTLARAYFLSAAYDRAEATLEELVPSIDSSTSHASSEYQELRWLRLATLKRRKAGESALLDAFRSIIDHMEFTETNITDVLQDLRTLTHQHNLVTAVYQHCLQRVLRLQGPGSDHVARLLLAMIFHCGKDEDHGRALQTIDTAFTCLCDAEFELPNIPTAACLTLLWQYGDRHYHAKRWSEAADWFLAGSHQLFKVNSPTAYSKCHRKAALCYIEQREFARASTVIRRCPTTEATTHYVTFLTAFHQGLEDEAIKAIQDMVKARDFDRKMLLLATQISHQSEMKPVLLSVLEALLNTLTFGNAKGEAIEEAMSLIRCIIRLSLKILDEPTANRGSLITNVVKHFHTAKVLTEEACSQKAMSLITKDVSWLWRTAYNSAIRACTEWEGTEQAPDLFDIARDLLEACCQASPVDVDVEIYIHLINASFSAVSGRVFQARDTTASSGSIDPDRLRGITAEVKSCKDKLVELSGRNKITQPSDVQRVEYFVHTLRVFEVELLAQLKEWDHVSQIIGEVTNSGAFSVGTYEAIADILWVEKECPINVLYSSLEAILRASLGHNSLSVEKFARWLRAICTIILARNTPEDRAKAIGYVEQALAVMEETHEGDESYPMDERYWLLGTSYNTGAECLHASMLDEAKRWFEASTVICKFVPEGKDRAEKISETYMYLLERYGSKSAV
ncbi:SPO22-domain-containing protein [Pluteus cervinus]|uniref:SPO22-domain-containing protein n=1 Tax=Pluteus cervinus TaxID=181527 RepID=A0ACD3ATC9_9AGAR|nr:SPO22-domain-containing protein [Pluteus cervinus]